MNDIFERINRIYHYKLKYVISVCIALVSNLFLGMIAIAIFFTDAVSTSVEDGIAVFILIMIPALYLRWFMKNWRSPNRSICQYYDINSEQMKQLIEKETFHDCNDEKIPSKFYQESSNYYMICGRFIAKKSVLSVNYIRTGSSGGRGAASNVYEFILSNGRRVSLSTPFYIQILGKVSPKFKEETEKRRYWSIFARARQSWIRAFYKQWVSNGNQPILLLTNEEVVTDYKNQLMKYIMQKERR